MLGRCSSSHVRLLGGEVQIHRSSSTRSHDASGHVLPFGKAEAGVRFTIFSRTNPKKPTDHVAHVGSVRKFCSYAPDLGKSLSKHTMPFILLLYFGEVDGSCLLSTIPEQTCDDSRPHSADLGKVEVVIPHLQTQKKDKKAWFGSTEWQICG